MIRLAQVNSLRAAHGRLHSGALADLNSVLSSLNGDPPDRALRQLFEVVPDVMTPYANLASDLSATFYEEVRAEARVRQSYTPKPLAEPVAPSSWNALIGFATADRALERAGALALYSVLSSGVSKRLTEVSADTMAENMALDPAPCRYQRVPAPGCCAFCGMLASRGAEYRSRESAGKVVGRGVPVEKTLNADGTRKRGGQAGGIVTRGKRPLGEDFHDHCRCEVVAAFGDDHVELQVDADRYYDEYREAADKINEGLTLTHTEVKAADGSLKRKYTWVHDAAGPTIAEGRNSMILAAMRQNLGVR